MAVMPGWDSGVVHPFLSLLWSAGGQYISDDYTKALFNSPEGLSTLNLYTDMITEQCIDTSIGSYTDFVNGKAAMIIMANWFRAELQASFVDGYENVGVVPIPTDGGAQSVALQYNWLWGVDNNSPHREEAWKFLMWLNSPTEPGKASPMGDYLTSALGAIPSRTSDQEALVDRLGDEFMKAYVASTATSMPEPIFAGGQEVKTSLQVEIEAAWYNQKTPEEALTFAEEEADRILSENK
jgi:multiple sugar transport system substrate-binding protein